jgi:hypothetical protein
MTSFPWRRVVIVAILVAFLVLMALVLLGTQVSGRLGGPCTYPEEPKPTFCA